MDQQFLSAEDVLVAAPPRLAYLRKTSSIQPIARDSTEGPPQSPLTETSLSTSSSQDSSTGDLADHPHARTLLAMSNHSSLRGADAAALDIPSGSHVGSLESSRSGNLSACFSELPSPSLLARDQSRPGRSRNNRTTPQTEQQRQPRRGSSVSSYHRHLFKQATKLGSGQSLSDAGLQEAAWSFESMVSIVRSLPAGQPAVPAIMEGLHYMDSRAVAALLKDIAKKGLAQRAIEIFDWLRGLPPTHELQQLCDVYTYTTVISLCGQRQSLRLALELVAEMKSRGILCNVHTYSALMNTCIKCGELDLALDVFKQLKVEGCAANVVTYNTLVDVYGKLGRWQEAIKVLDQVYLDGLVPETRTFNTVIIAANICNQPIEALKVYDRMVASGLQPTDTTFTALVSAYCKAGQLDTALRVFDQMLQQRCERNIITYGSLITACEKAGRWQLALQLHDEMRRDQPPVTPNTMTYNALLGACAQGAQSEKAELLFHSMLSRRCKPDSAAHNSVLLAHLSAGHWRAAIQALETMQSAGFPPETAIYAGLVHCLWESGIGAAQAHASSLFEAGIRSRLLAPPLQVLAGRDGGAEVHIAAANSSIAVLALMKWLRQLQQAVDAEGSSGLSAVTRLTFGVSQPDAGHGLPEVVLQLEAAIVTALEGLNSPFRVEASAATACMVATATDIENWLQVEDVAMSIADYVPSLPPDGLRGSLAFGRTAAAQEAAANARQVESHTLFCQAERHQEARTTAAQRIYAGSRGSCVQLAAQLARSLSLPQEAAYRSMVLLDYALIAGVPYSVGGAAILVAACLVIASESPGSFNDSSQLIQDLEHALKVHEGVLPSAVEQLRSVRVAHTPVVSPTPALNRYLAHLLHDPVNERSKSDSLLASPRAKARAVGSSVRLLAAAMLDPSTQHIRPSLLAAAALAADRVRRGVLPVWPASLAAWTGLSLEGGAERSPLAAAARLVSSLPAASF